MNRHTGRPGAHTAPAHSVRQPGPPPQAFAPGHHAGAVAQRALVHRAPHRAVVAPPPPRVGAPIDPRTLLAPRVSDAERRLDAIRQRLKKKVTPAPFPTVERPNKPASLSRAHPVTNEPLTFHHKLNSNKILAALQQTIDTADETLLEKLRVFAGYARFSDDFKQRLFKRKPSNAFFVSEFKKFQTALVWSSWNGFFGDVPERRLDDPKRDIDAHYRPDGSVTPRTQLAHDIGAGFTLDVAELGRRLAALATRRPTEFDPAEWGSVGNLTFQAANPSPAARIVSPDLSARTPRDFELRIGCNNATRAVWVIVGGPGRTRNRRLAQGAGNLRTFQINGLAPNGEYDLTVIVSDRTNPLERGGTEVTLQARFRVDATLTPGELRRLQNERQQRQNAPDAFAGEENFGINW